MVFAISCKSLLPDKQTRLVEVCKKIDIQEYGRKPVVQTKVLWEW